MKTILVVEDNPIDVMLLERTFRRLELWDRVVVVNNGQEAIDYLSAASARSGDVVVSPYVVVLDLKLPLKSGFEVLTWIRSTSALRHLPVVVFTSSKDSDDVARAYECGANSYMVKTPDQGELARIATLLNDYWLNYNLPG